MPRKTNPTIPLFAARKSRFNEAAARCRGKPLVVGGVALQATRLQ